MNILLTIVKLIAAIILITYGCSKISEASNLSVAIGILEIALALILVYSPFKKLFKQF